jgi:phosphoribosylamine--glycine ligase
MNVLVIGGGGREHALTWAIQQSPDAGDVYVAPGNGGTGVVAKNVAIDPMDIDGLLAFVGEHNIELTVVGPEAPLVAGIVDRFRAAGQRCFGPTKAAAQLEGSKVFAKEFMKRHGIPTAGFAVCSDVETARREVKEMGSPVVIKADGLAAGKGVFVAASVDEAYAAVDEIMVARKFGDSGGNVVIEEFLDGEEVSVHSVCAGGGAVAFPTSQDHKRVSDGDKGPNTGGMGAYAPVPFVSEEQKADIYETIVRRTLTGMEAEGSPFSGVLYTGLMMTPSGPKVLEYNVRFGDPETQVLMPLVKSDMLRVLCDAADGSLDHVEFHGNRAAATIVMAAEGYPGSYEKGHRITGLDEAGGEDCVVFHAGTTDTGEGVVTSGGRVLSVTAWQSDLPVALKRAYDGIGKVHFAGAHWRKDIGRRAL